MAKGNFLRNDMAVSAEIFFYKVFNILTDSDSPLEYGWISNTPINCSDITNGR